MSLLIKNVEMPKTCHCCRMCVQVSDGDIDWHWECCLLCEKVARYATDRIPGCPLFPVPKHGRLGDLDRMLADNEIYYNQLGRMDGEIGARYRSVKRSIELAPTIIEADWGDDQ